MSGRTKLVVLGGSALATPLLFDSMGRAGGQGAYEAVLVGRDPERLALVERISRELLLAHPRLDVRLRVSQNAEEALDGADYCLNQIRVGGLEARAFDETFPRQFGIPGEETVGPGGFDSALRTLPVALEYGRMIARQAPGAVVINLTNPSSLVQFALRTYASLSVIGTCDAPVSLMEMIARLLGAAAADLEFKLAGMHHFTWVGDVRQGGASRLPEILRRLEELPKLGVDPEIVRAIGAIPSVYFRYFFHPDRVLAATEGRAVRAQQLMTLNAQMLEALRRAAPGEAAGVLARRGAVWYDKIVTPTLLALAEKRTTRLVLSVDNGGALSYLPDDGIVEAWVPIEAGRIGRPEGATLPPEAQALLHQNSVYERLAAEAIVERDRAKALRALMANRMVPSFNLARGILDLIWPTEQKAHVRVELPEAEKGASALKLPTLSYGDRLLESFQMPEGSYALVTMEEPWALAKDRLGKTPAATVFVRDLDAYALEAMERALPDVDAVVGLGGGTPTDAAKYLGWRRRIPVDLFPSITSVDAAVTKSIASRLGRHVTYIGHIVPRRVMVDYTLIQAAPPRLNRSGVGDILCAHVALRDWQLAHERGAEGYDAHAAQATQVWLDRIASRAGDIAEVSPAGIQLIMQAFEDISVICRRYGSSRPQEGSDHTFAYNTEFQTGKAFLHGELVALGAYFMACLQENQPEWLQSVYDRCGLLWRPLDIGLTRDEFMSTALTVNWYQSNLGRRFTILDVLKVERKFAEAVWDRIATGS